MTLTPNLEFGSKQFGIGKLTCLSPYVPFGSSFEALDCVNVVQIIQN